MSDSSHPVISRDRIRAAWAGRVSGCVLGKPVEVLSFQEGREGLTAYLAALDALPLRDYVPLEPGSIVDRRGLASCRGFITRAEPDDDINYTVLALLLLESKGIEFDTSDVARAWLNLLPAGSTWTAEREAYRILLDYMDPEFVNGDPPGFDLAACSANQFNDWIGAQIRADLYGWVCPDNVALAAELCRRDASLSHRGVGVHGAVFVAALGAVIPSADGLDTALDAALDQIPSDSGAAAAVRLGRRLAGADGAVDELHRRYSHLSPVHTVNNLAVVVWALSSAGGDFSRAIGDAVAAGWDTDCNGATVGGLAGLMGMTIPDHWTAPWAGRIGVGLAGLSELTLEHLVDRTMTVAEDIQRSTGPTMP